jgi:hypothetical protein
MNLAKILTVLQSAPFLCANDDRSALLELFQQHSTLSANDFRMAREGKGRSGEEVSVEQSTIEEGICIIPVGGPIGAKLGSFEKGAGAVDVDDIAAEIRDEHARKWMERGDRCRRPLVLEYQPPVYHAPQV